MEKRFLAYCIAATLGALLVAPAWAGYEGNGKTFYGNYSGYSDLNPAVWSGNTLIGYSAGENTTGSNNTALGTWAGYSNVTGQGNVFLGFSAGYSETGWNKLYIDNCSDGSAGCTTPFIYGEFDNRLLKIDGTVAVTSFGASKSQLHFSKSGGDAGGWLTSVLDNNFFVSSGATYSAVGWIQKSSDTNAVIAGSGSAGYRVFTHTGATVGTSFSPTVRLHINYAGEFGINQAPVAGHEIHTSSGAYLVGGTWYNASSREYKDNINSLSGEAAAQALAALNPVTFSYKSDAGQQHVGFIAEDVPELVAAKDRKGLSAMDIVAVLTKVVQEKSRIIDEQQAMLGETRDALAQLKAELAALKAEAVRNPHY